MGQKVHPIALRLGYIKGWSSRWFAKKKDFAGLLQQDIKLRNFIKNRFSSAAVSKIEIERSTNKVKVIIYTARPGVVIGRRGQEIDRLKEDARELTGGEIYVEIREVKNPQVNAQLVAENISFQLERRVSFRRAMKKAITNAMNNGALGIKVACAGRLQGAEIARSEGYKKGKIPLHTFRADIDYGFCGSRTAYGLIGVKVWIYKGEILGEAEHGTDAKKSKAS